MEKKAEYINSCINCKSIEINGKLISSDCYVPDNFIDQGLHFNHLHMSRTCEINWIESMLRGLNGRAPVNGSENARARIEKTLEDAKTKPYNHEKCPRDAYETLAQYDSPLDFFAVSSTLPILPLTRYFLETPISFKKQ